MTAERVRPTPRQAPPHSLDAERALLGSVLLDRSVVGRVTSIVQVTDFYSSQYGMIYATMAAIWERSEAVDYLTVMTELERTGTIREAGGMKVLAGLIDDVPTPLHAESYAQIVADAAVCRRLVSAGSQIASLGWRQEPDALAQAEQILDTVLPDRSTQTSVSLASSLSDLMDTLSRPESASTIIRTGYGDLDWKLRGGLHREDLAILAGRPGQGKSAMALSLAINAARNGTRVLLFSLEMAAGELTERALSVQSGIPSRRFRQSMTPDEVERLGAALNTLALCDITIDASPALSIGEIRSRVRSRSRQAPVDLVVVDHLQLVTAPGNGNGRVYELGDITSGLKRLARDHGVAVLALAQLSRKIEERKDHTPMLSDLRDSGNLEQDADVVLMLSRPDDAERQGTADLLIAKHRNGPTGLVSFYFDQQTTAFRALDVGH